IVVTDFDTGLGFDTLLLPPPNRLFTSARTFSYSAFEIPNDLRLVSLPLPCFPAITPSAIFEIDLPEGLGVLEEFTLPLLEPMSFANCEILTPHFAKYASGSVCVVPPQVFVT